MRPAPHIENFSADRPRTLKAARSRRATLRRRMIETSIEALESRTLMAVLPPVTAASATLQNILTADIHHNYSTPTIVIDPVNSQKLVASWQGTVDNNPGQFGYDQFVQAATSVDGGATWQVFYTSTPHLDPTVATNPPTLRDTSDVTVAIGANEGIYVLSRNHNAANSVGFLDLATYTFGPTGATGGTTKTIGSWLNSDQILEPTIAVDNNRTTYTDTTDAGITHTITDPFVNNVYVAWVTNTAERQPANQNPPISNRVVMISSSDFGATFTPWHVVDDSRFNDKNASPKLIISQGSFDGRVSPGAVTIAWDDFGTNSTVTPTPTDILRADTVLDGGTGKVFGGGFALIADAVDPGNSLPHVPGVTDVPIGVDINDPNFTTLSGLTVSLNITHPNLDQLLIQLVPPSGSGLPTTTLVRNRTDAAGNPIPNANTPQGISGANLGLGPLSTTFDDNALLGITDANSGGAAYVGRYRPEGGNLFGNYAGLTAAQLNGQWTLRITDTRSNGTNNPPPAFLSSVSVDFGSGLTTGIDRTIATTTVRGALQTGAGVATFPTASAASPNGIGPGLALAADNTLGAFSPYQGRIYAAYVDRAVIDGNPADNTNVYLVHSDDGGQSWSGPRQVNDDFPTSDGFSEGDRPQFEPAIAVDQSTGTLVYSYLDTRYDAAKARVITSVTTSIDGGGSFATSNYANPSKTAIDAITGQTLSPSPIPSNQSAGNPVRDAAFGFGSHQALAVANGVIYAGWSSNIAFANGQYLTGGRDGTQRLSIALRKMTTAAGPRIVSGTMGPILAGDSTNTSRQADGTPIANTIIVTFDRPVDPNSFDTGDVQVFYRNTDVNGSPVSLNIVGVAPLNTGFTGPGQARGATRFRITFTPPAGSGVGTYSYIVGPNVNDRIRTTSAIITAAGGPTTLSGSGAVLQPGGTIGSSVFANTGNPADVVAQASVFVSISNTGPDSALRTSALTLTLVSPQGTRIVLAQGLGGNTRDGYNSTTFQDGVASRITTATAPFNGTFRPQNLLAYLNGEKINGTWTLQVTDADGDPANAAVLVSWSLFLTKGSIAPPSPSGNSMDQNANAVADQAIVDRFVIPAPLNGSGTLTTPYDPDTLPLIVPGPSILATHVAGAANTNDNLVLNNTASSIDLTFDRYMDASTFTPSDVLRIQGPSGVLAGPYTVTPVYNSQNVNININPAGITTSTLTVPALGGPFTIGDLNVQVNLSQAHAADLTLTLIAPNGTRIKLAQGLGGTVGKNYTDTVFDDQAASPIGAGTAPFNGSFRPVESLGVLNGLDLKGSGGVWKLEIVNAGGDTGALNAWSLAVTPQAGTTVYATTFRIGFPQQQLSGTYIVSLGSDIKSMAGDSLDSNHNAGVDILKGTATNGATVPITYVSTDVPRAIPDATSDNATPPVITPGVATSTIQVTDSYVPTDVTVTLSINDPFDPDLEVTLIAPDGVTRITLVNQRGQGVSTANFQGTIFNDAGTTLIKDGGAPFNGGPYKPEQSLNIPIANQINVNGTWTLEIKDHKTGNTGTLVSWSLTFKKPVPSSGLGEIAADQTSASFRIFTEATTNLLSNSVWTAVGPGAGGSGRGRVGGLAVDPSDPSGNTVYIGGASGGVWKTTNFLTTAPGGPTYIPVTSFGPTNSANIGGIAIIGRNNDPSQSIIFAATGEGDTGSPGVGFLRSMDGGATWVTLDSAVNFDGSGNLLPMNSPSRNHIFVGTTSFKIAADPKLSPTGDAIVYAALSGTNGGIWRSENSGRTWQLMRAGQATDVALDQASGTGAPGGNLQIVYGAFRGEGVYFSPNRGQVWNQMVGGIGNPLIQDGDVNPSIPIVVKPPVATPNGPKGRIVLATPGLTGNATKDLLYQGWVYALVVTTNDHLDGLYVTKDFGRNWTRVRIPTLPPVPAAGGGNSQVRAVPTNDYSAANPDYDVAGNAVFAQGNYDIAMTIDPTNPNVVYIGGTNDGQPSSLVRVDITYMHDAHSAVAFDETNPDGGLNSTATTGGIALKAPADPTKGVPAAYYNLNGQPGDPFGSSTIAITNTASFTNDGTDARWIPFDFTIGDNHRFIAIKDPLTGHARLIAGDDHGVWTAVDDNGTMNSGVGTAITPSGDRTGNLQIIQFYYGAAQPTGTAFYGQAQDNGSPTSGNALATGNIGWSGPLGDGTGVATDQTGSGTVYRFNWPCCGGNGTDFFQVNGVGRTQGLILASNPGNTPDPEWPFVGGVNFAVNPINGNQILISSTTGRVFSTENQGVFWSVIGEPAIFGGSNAPALAYGAPDPNGPAGLGNLDNLLYVGTNAGHIFMSQTGGGGNPANAWTDISAGLDGSGVRSIVTNPNRGSHEAYAVTNNGVFHIVDSTAPGATWVNITANLFQITHTLFNNPGQVDTLLRGLTSLAVDWRYVIPTNFANPSPVGTFPILYVGGNGGVFRSINNGVSWTRFPNIALNDTPNPPGDGGGLPVVQVNDLDLALGVIDPTTGRPNTATSQNILLATTFGQGSFAIRLAPVIFPSSLSLDYTAPLLPAQGGSDSGNTALDQRDFVTNVTSPVIDGFSAQSAFGQVVTVKLYDLTDPTNPVQIGQGTTDGQGFFKVAVDPGHFLPDGTTDGLKTIGVQAVDQNGAVGNLETLQFTLDTTPPAKPAAPDLQAASDSGISSTDNITSVTAPSFDVTVIESKAKVVLYRDGVAIVTLFDVSPDANGKLVLTDPTAPEGTHVYTVRQTDASTNLGPMSDPISVTFDYTTPTAPTGLDLEAGDDTGISATDNNTQVNTLLHFDASAIEPKAKLELLRDGAVVNTIANVGPTGGTITITDPTPLIPDGIYSYTVRQTDLAGNVSLVGSALSVTIDTTKPVAPAAPDLQAADDGGFSNTDNLTNINTNLHFDVAGIETGGKNAKVELFRDGVSIGVFLNTAGGTITFTDTAVLADGQYTYTARQTDLAGNVSDVSGPLVVTIDTSSPLIPSVPDLIDANDHGSSNTDNVTNVTNPTFNIANARATAVVKLYRKLHDPLNVNDPNSDDYTFIAQITGPGQVQDVGPVADGVYDYAALQLSDAGVAGPLSAALVVTIDTAAPAVSSVPDLQPSSDHGTFNNDNITNATAPTFDVTTAEVTATVHLLRTDSNNVTIEVGTRVGPGAITDPGLNQPDGVYTYTSFQTDLAGNVGPTSTGLAVTIDRTVPAVSSVPDLQAGSDSGFSSTDNITFVKNPFFDVPSAEATAIVHLLRNGVEVATRTGPGAIQDPGLVPDGVYTYTTFQTDLAGNAGPASAGLTVTIDGTAPVGPAPDLQAGSDTGQSDSDNITSATLLAQVGGFPKFDITPIEQGAFVELFRNGVLVDSGRLLTSAGVITLSDRGPTFPDGQYIYTTRQTDLAGNVGPLGTPLTVTVDNTAPLSPNAPDLQAASDSGPSSTDNITAVTNPTFDIANTEPGAILKLVRDGAVVRTLTNIAGGTVSIQDPGPVPDGTHIYSAYEIDAAGNIGPLGGAVQVVVDTLTPNAPSIPDLQAASDSGASSVDNLTNVAGGTASDGITPLPGPTFDITNIDPGATVQLLRNGLVVNSKVNTGGVGATISITDPGPIAPDGVYNYSSRQIDAAGNSGPVSGALSVTFDTAALVPGAPDLEANSDTGNPTDNITSVTTPTFDVTGTETGATVTLYRKLSGSADSTYVPVASRVGDGPLLDPGPLADGTYVYSLTETDLAGNVSGRSATLAVTFLTAAPGTPAAPDLQALSDTPLPGGIGYVAGTTDIDNVTSLHSLTFNVAVAPADAGATVQLLRNGVVVNSRVGSGTLIDVVPSDGTYSYTLQEINVVDTPSLPSAALVVKVDSLAPTTPAAPDLENGSDTGNPTDNVTSVTSPTFDVAGVEANATVQLLRNGVVVSSKANAGADGATIAITDPGPLASGQYTYTTRIYDVAGNVSGISPSLAVTIDTTAPPKPAAPDLTAASDSGASDTDNITNVVGGTGKQAPVFNVSGVGAGLTVQLLRKVAGASDLTYIIVNTAEPSAASPVSITDPRPINDGKYVYAVRTVAPAGGQSVLSATLTVTYDTRPVAVLNPVLANPYGSRATTTVSRNPLFTGTTEPGVNVSLFVDTATGRQKVGGVISDATTGAFSIPVAQAMLNGSYKFSLAVVDPAGNIPANGSIFGNTLAVTVTSVFDDYDGDGKADMAFDRIGTPSSWQILGSAAGLSTTNFGNAGDVPISGDFDGDGKTDIAVFRPAGPTATYPTFIIKPSGGGQSIIFSIGGAGDVPAVADYDGDGKADMAVYRPSTGQWFIRTSSSGQYTRTFGGGNDMPVPADYQGVGSAQLAVFRPSSPTLTYPLFIVQNPGRASTVFSVGGAGDVPMPADYNGDGKADFAVYRPNSSQWFVRYAGGGGQDVQVGTPNDIPVTADYDGDGKADTATYRASTGLWSINQSTGGPRVQTFGGSSTDVPVPSPYSYRQQASVTVNSGTRAASRSFDLGSTASKLANTVGASRVQVNQVMKKR